MKSFFNKFSKDQSGQALTEYAMILALVVLVAVVALSPLGDKIKEIFEGIVKGFDGTTAA